MTEEPRTQNPVRKFKELAREVEANEDEARWDERLMKVAKHEPEPEKPE